MTRPAALCALLLLSCERHHQPLAQAPELPAPACADGGAPELWAEHVLKADASLQEGNVVERYRVESLGCLVRLSTRLSFSGGVTEAELVVDERGRPLTARRRMTREGTSEVDERRYELRSGKVLIRRSQPPLLEELTPTRSMREAMWGSGAEGPGAPVAVVGPGRGLLSSWIRSARLEVGQKQRVRVLDFREAIEVLRDVTLKREQDRVEPSLGGTVRVYTVYGREAVFTDEAGFVIGDLAGLRRTAPSGVNGSP